jgi:hypothetical protein
MSPLEFVVFALYMTFLLFAIVTIQSLEASRLQMRGEESEETLVESETVEESASEDERVEEASFSAESEEYTMTENPMLRHRIVDQEVDMEAVD